MVGNAEIALDTNMAQSVDLRGVFEHQKGIKAERKTHTRKRHLDSRSLQSE